MRQRARKWLKRGIVGILIALPVWFAVTVVRSVLSGDPFVPQPTGCSEVAEFAGGRMPEEATDKKCLDDGGWFSRGYTAEFRMPRKDVAARLTRAFPRVTVGYEQPDKLRLSVPGQSEPSQDQAQCVYIDVTYEDAVTALVKLQAFNT